MRVDFRYFRRSGVRETRAGLEVAFAPNLARPAVFFDAEISRPLRFREAVGALHDVVVGDLRHKPRDRSAYLRWKAEELRREDEIRAHVRASVRQEEIARMAGEEPPPGLEEQFRRMHAVYWRARRKWAGELAKNDPEMFRHLVPCDPVVTVAPDAVFFECFSKDESSYGFLSVDRGAFRAEGEAGFGTTNVDYSLALYEQFQTLRSYRPARLLVDPSGFEASVAGAGSVREEKIDLPSSWLRGFGQLQAAGTLPARRVELTREAVYSILAYLKRHREKAGPRSLRFRLAPGMPPVVVLDPWGVEVESRGALYSGREAEEVKVWGRRRLMALARLLPLAERVEVRLVGSGLPSFWTVEMGEMRFTLALSGWTANDWAGGASLDALADVPRVAREEVERVGARLDYLRHATAESLAESLEMPRDAVSGALYELARRGMAVYDAGAELYRWRPALPEELSDAALGPEPPEVAEGRRLFSERRVRVEREAYPSPERRFVAARVEQTACEAVFDADGKMTRARCTCSFFHKSRLRRGPCRHLLALKLSAVGR